ncbi:FkbM family methyltransferase [Pectobacterium brasiliense]|uniref:FkbM family methyltransferase n=1 Tax=Pectobacterium brasiliense TaxID=180957 RepID=UPI002A811983|nr:FkbM family methyltransferase [Pectobacterium brasiliense]MDY4366632.1 FkbM family methyltransferase [Pectobacterium brasiliense]MDY7056163.1 FkbM family methyltransferase [Pectobacterium brasiliense]
MTLMSGIIEQDNVFLHSLNRMKENGYPIVLCGAGMVARLSFDFLQEVGADVDIVTLHREYVKESDLFCGKKLTPLEDLITREEKYNYIVAFQFFNEKLEIDLKRNGAEVLFFDPSFIDARGNDKEYITWDFLERNESELEWFYSQLGDDFSRKTLQAFINQRICARQKTYYSDMYCKDHYFPDDIISLSEGEVFIDCGAYTGDTIAALLKKMASLGIEYGPEAIYAFEPDECNAAVLEKNTRHLPQCHCMNMGAWREKSVLFFASGDGLSSRISAENDNDTTSIAVDSIDNILNGRGATFIKMDIEGAELDALYGAEKTIVQCAPKLAISLYHKPKDLITIPKYLRELNPDYKFYLRGHHPNFACELVLYAITVD